MEILLYIYTDREHKGELLIHLRKKMLFTTLRKFYFETQDTIYRLLNCYQIPIMGRPKASCLLVAV